MRMILWKVRAAKTLHLQVRTCCRSCLCQLGVFTQCARALQRILEVVGLVFLVGIFGFLFAWAAGKCVTMPEDW
jgi:hypothetical protein